MSRRAHCDPEIRKPEPSMPLFEREATKVTELVKDNGPRIDTSRFPEGEQSFAKFEQAHARKSDPITSHQVAAKITNLGPVRDAIINALYTFGPQTDEGIAGIFKKWAAFPKCSPSGLRSRRSELVTLGFVEDSGELGKTEMGNDAIIWKLSVSGRAK